VKGRTAVLLSGCAAAAGAAVAALLAEASADRLDRGYQAMGGAVVQDAAARCGRGARPAARAHAGQDRPARLTWQIPRMRGI
jgi:hypothetical protein